MAYEMASSRMYYRVIGTKAIRSFAGGELGRRNIYHDVADLEAARTWVTNRLSREPDASNYRFTAILRVTEIVKDVERFGEGEPS
jgi:hypothetical protein